MRRSREEAAETRRKAIETASRLYRDRGLEAVSVSDVMSAIGMTVGGFYRHFDSKDDLVAEACRRAFDEVGQARDAALGAADCADPLATLFGRYLSRAHRDAPASGCPIPSLLSSVPRQSPSVRRVFTEAIQRTHARLEKLAPEAAPDARIAALASMFGALALARAVDDDELSTRLLHDTRNFWTRALREASAPGPAPGGSRRPPSRRRSARGSTDRTQS